MVDKYPKLRYRLTPILGDLYYEEMPLIETLEKAFIWWDSCDRLASLQELDFWIEDNLNVKLPYDGP